MKSFRQAPALARRSWGLQSADAMDLVSRALTDEGFAGPAAWVEGRMVTYGPRMLCDGIAARASLSVHRTERGHAVFGGGVVLLSRTLHDAWPDEPPPRTSPTGLHATMRPCLSISLEHLKWCEAATPHNPSWQMTLERDGDLPTAGDFVRDFRALALPVVEAVRSDEDLERLLVDCLDRRRKPAWVRSDRPWFVRLPELAALLQSRRQAA
jgi:hypothetical protein